MKKIVVFVWVDYSIDCPYSMNFREVFGSIEDAIKAGARKSEIIERVISVRDISDED